MTDCVDVLAALDGDVLLRPPMMFPSCSAPYHAALRPKPGLLPSVCFFVDGVVSGLLHKMRVRGVTCGADRPVCTGLRGMRVASIIAMKCNVCFCERCKDQFAGQGFTNVC